MNTIYTKQLRRDRGGPYCLDTKEEYPPNFLCSSAATSIIPCKWSELPHRLNFRVSKEPVQGWHEGILINENPENCLYPCFNVLFNGSQYDTFLALERFLTKECGLKDQDHFWFQAIPINP